MQKSIRTFALVAVLALTVAPAALVAETTGTNPKPPAGSGSPSSYTDIDVVMQVMMAYFGM